MRNPARSPKACRVYAYGPPADGLKRASGAKPSARSTDPAVDRAQPARLTPPKGASDAGSRNTPEPIMLPITSATAIENPIPEARAVVIGERMVARGASHVPRRHVARDWV